MSFDLPIKENNEILDLEFFVFMNHGLLWHIIFFELVLCHKFPIQVHKKKIYVWIKGWLYFMHSTDCLED